ncbi:MAG TPA: hypothetical protein VLC92_19415 [Rhodocyclaceae bacterium]|nr:hypothetical protein [Rhodocyclaceae bacterium]
MYDARRAKLEGKYWKGLFGFSHGVCVVNTFYENVSRHRAEGRELAADKEEQSTVLEFRLQPQAAVPVTDRYGRTVSVGLTMPIGRSSTKSDFDLGEL